MKNTIEWTRVNADSNGNSRHVCHFLAFIGPKDSGIELGDKYALALSRARRLGGRKFHNKQYGGGIVFQEQPGCLDNLTARILTIACKPDFVAMSRRATIVCTWKNFRWCVVIRDYPKRYYNPSDAETVGIHGADQAEYFAEKRISELGLNWVIQAAGTLPTGEAVFTV